MDQKMQEVAWRGVGALSAVLAGVVTRQLLSQVWRRTRGGPPPANPASRQTSWPEAVTYAVASGVVIAIARLVSTRAAAGAWEKYFGVLPPGLEDVEP